jgi:AcrR family transcriptional regulator
MNSYSRRMPSALKAETAKLRRDYILQAATDVFAKQGFRNATIKQVAKAAGVADGTIYNVFANKDAMLNALLDKLRPEKNEPPGNTMQALLQQRVAALEPETLKVLRVVLAEALVDPDLRSKFLKRILHPAIDPLEAALKDQPRAADTSRVMVAMFMGVAVLKLLGEAHISAHTDSVVQRMAEMMTSGLDT